MFIGGVPQQVIDQLYGLLPELDTSRVYVCCSGSFRSERAILQFDPAAAVFSNDVSFYSCVLGGWLADQAVPYRLVRELEWLEALIGEEADPARRAAGVCLALEVSDWAKGKPNPYKATHLAHLKNHASDLLVHLQAKLAAAFGERRLAGFMARDWREHAEQAITEGATIIGFPPTYKGGYEAMYRWLDANVEWSPPSFDTYDPADLPAIVARIAMLSPSWCFISDHLLPDMEARTLYQAPGKRPVYLYASAGEARVSRSERRGKPFAFTPLEPGRIHRESICRVERALAPEAFYVRTLFLKKSVSPTTARISFFVYIDDMLAGVLAYKKNELARVVVKAHFADGVYLLSDLSTTRERRVSKLISRLALNGQVLDSVAAFLLHRIGFVETTAFSDHPASMKYRGIFKLLGRREAPPPDHGWQLQYGGERLAETPQQAFDWWWSKHGQVDEARASPSHAAAGAG